MASILTHELGSKLNCQLPHDLNGTDSLHDGIDRIYNKYDISNRCETLGSKQFRYEIETVACYLMIQRNNETRKGSGNHWVDNEARVSWSPRVRQRH